MNCIMDQLYTGFIEPHILHQPKDDLYTIIFDEYEHCAAIEEQDRTEAICEFYALHAFLLGLRMGHALTESLAAPGGDVSRPREKPPL